VSLPLALHDVCLRISGADVLSGASLALAEGEIVALLGPSGAGKTTLVRVALGLVAPDTGAVLLDGRRASGDGRISIAPEARRLAVVFQDLALWPHLTVEGNLRFGLRARGTPRDEARARIAAMLERVSLRGRERRYPGELSGGERQRTAIARALVLEPRAVLLDEPLANLDVALKRDLLALFRELLAERATAALYVTHDPREALGLTRRWAVLESGRVVQQGDPGELRAAPSTAFVRALLADLDGG
jgi:iron(III) transport system ATP-binding protein